MGSLKNIKILRAEARVVAAWQGLWVEEKWRKVGMKVQCFTQTEEITSGYLFHSLVTVDYS